MIRKSKISVKFVTQKLCYKKPTCYKNTDKLSCIDLILTNVPRMFLQSASLMETGMSYFNFMTLTVIRKTFKKVRCRIINYRWFKHFFNETLRTSLESNLSKNGFIFMLLIMTD